MVENMDPNETDNTPKTRLPYSPPVLRHIGGIGADGKSYQDDEFGPRTTLNGSMLPSVGPS